MNITLPAVLDRIVRDKVKAGLYANESELVSEALRHEFARDTVSESVRVQAANGFAQLDAGECESMTRDEFFARMASADVRFPLVRGAQSVTNEDVARLEAV